MSLLSNQESQANQQQTIAISTVQTFDDCLQLLQEFDLGHGLDNESWLVFCIIII